MNKLMEKRKKSNLTREDLSKKTGVSAEKIRDLELSLANIKEQDDQTIDNLAKALNIEPLKLKQGCYYKQVGEYYRIAQLQYVIVTHEEWKKLKWVKTDVLINHIYKYKKDKEDKNTYIYAYCDAAFALGYKMFSGVNTCKSDENLQTCYIKNNKLYMFSTKWADDDTIYITEIPRKPEDVILR